VAGPFVAGVDLGGTKIQVVAVNGTAVKGGSRTATPTTSAEDVVHEIVGSVRLAVQQAGGRLSGLDKVGIGTPGKIDGRKGVVSHSGNVVGMMDPFALGPAVSKELGGLPVVIDNDVRVAILGEYERGAGRHYKNVLGVFVGTGVGGGLVLEGKLREGRGAAGEIGHTLVKPGGRVCSCGRRGCLEAYAGRGCIEATARRWQAKKRMKTELFEIMADRRRDRLTSGVIAAALERKDKMAEKLIDEAIKALGIAIANAQNLLDLEAVIIGGGLGDRLGKPFVDKVAEATRPHLHVPDKPPDIIPTELGDLAGAVGAAILAGG
jgi:glucokinase